MWLVDAAVKVKVRELVNYIANIYIYLFTFGALFMANFFQGCWTAA